MNGIHRNIWLTALDHQVEIEHLPDALEKAELEAMNLMTYDLLGSDLYCAYRIQAAIRKKLIKHLKCQNTLIYKNYYKT